MSKKKKLSEHFADASAKYNGPCRFNKKTKALEMCPALAAVIGVHNEDHSRPGFELAPMLQWNTGKSIGPKLVYFVRRAEYVEVEYCQFCGNKVSKPAGSKRAAE